jgi:hypothetical protein
VDFPTFGRKLLPIKPSYMQEKKIMNTPHRFPENISGNKTVFYDLSELCS